MKKFNLKFIPLLALTFILSNACFANSTTELVPTALAQSNTIGNTNLNIAKLNKLNSNLWHYRRDSLNTHNLNQINTIFNNKYNIPATGMISGGSEIIRKTTQILNDLYQGYFIGYANKKEKLLILDALKNFNENVPKNYVIKNLLDKARKSLATLDDLITEFSKNYTPFIRKIALYKGWISKNKNLVKKELNIDELLKLTNKQQPNNIDFLPTLSIVYLHAIKAIEDFQKEHPDYNLEKKKEILTNIVKDKMQRLKNYGWIRRNKIEIFKTMVNRIKIEKNKVKQLESVKALLALNLHKISGQHAQLTYDLLYKILYL